jgi:hypothetical protein
MLAHDTFAKFLASVYQEDYNEDDQEQEAADAELRLELFTKFTHEIQRIALKDLKNFFKRFVEVELTKSEDCPDFKLSVEESESTIRGLSTKMLVLLIRNMLDLARTVCENLRPLPTADCENVTEYCSDAQQYADEFEDMPLMESSSDSDSVEESDPELDEIRSILTSQIT